MKENGFRKGLVYAIVVLFIGVSIIPLTGSNGVEGSSMQTVTTLYDGAFHDVGVEEITEPSGPPYPWPPGGYPVEAVVKNYGTFNETDFNVNVKIWALSEDDDDELHYEDDSLVTTSMSPGDEATVVFTDVGFPEICILGIVTYRMEVTTELFGDNVSDNDQKVMFFTIRYSGLPPIPELNGTWGEYYRWYVSCVTITFIDRDPYEDYVTYYKLNDGEWQIYDEPFIVCEDSRYTLYYYSIDSHENIEGEGEVDFQIDQTAPTISLTAEKTGSNTWLLIADVFDETSGVARVEFYVNGDPVGTVMTAPYEWEVTNPKMGDKAQAIVYDNAGNDAVSEEVECHMVFFFGILDGFALLLQHLLGVLGWYVR